ncbi:MAG TPA: hypothetical protein DC047_20935 [Blastocatellia bacterium]|nr:hypothetical protein [Blastocatellia bacterium]
MANGGDIIIKGSSVDIDYDDTKYPKEAGKPRNHKASDQTITRVTVEDGNNTVKYDSNNEAAADPSQWIIHIYCAAPTKPASKP